ncbi:NEDD8-activating enzyme E1 [Nematocida sp. AWRm77]|nr:NEDD8-activating enzyme E1 [Nematocida sp. AWRm77]
MKLCILGLGGLGSSVACTLVERFGEEIEEIHLIDEDRVEYPNLATQMYTEEDVGEYKVHAMQKRLREVFRGEVFVYVMNINMPEAEIQRALGCTVYISAVDNYQSRVNFYYYLVSEAERQPEGFLYVDGGSERFRGHCFYTRGRKTDPCIFCIKWLFPEEKRYAPLCSLRNKPGKGASITPERKHSVLMSFLEEAKEEQRTSSNRSNGSNSSNGSNRSNGDVYALAAARFNEEYGEEVGRVQEEEVEQIEEAVLPTVCTTNTILANIISHIVRHTNINTSSSTSSNTSTNTSSNTSSNTNTNTSSVVSNNFILYSGDALPVFHQHLLEKDFACIVCSSTKDE